MTIETIDNVLYYVWRAGDELPKYRPIKLEAQSSCGWYKALVCNPDMWDVPVTRRWPKLLNDRAQHQRMIDEACKTNSKSNIYDAIHDNWQWFIEHEKADNRLRLLSLAQLGAGVKGLMEYVQEQIDKEETK